MALFLLLLISPALYGQAFPKPPADPGFKPKNVHGIVQDARGKRLSGARVFLKDMKTKVVRTLESNGGLRNIRGVQRNRIG
jgi:hypothetical protein